MILAILVVLLAIAAFGAAIFFLGPLATLLIVTSLILGVVFGVIGPLVLVQLPGVGPRVASMLRASAAATLYRPTITFGDSTDLLLRRRTYNDELGREVIPGDDDEIVIENPADAIHPWHGQPLTLVDELFGVAIDPRHSAAGETLRQHILDGTLFLGDLRGWLGGQSHVTVPAYSEIPRQAHRVVLDSALSLLWGYEEGDHPSYAEEIFKKSQIGRVDNFRARQMWLPFAALVLTYALMWIGAEWGPSGGGGGGGSTLLPIGGALPLLPLSLRRPRPLRWARKRRPRPLRWLRSRRARAGDGDSSPDREPIDWTKVLHRLIGLVVSLSLLSAYVGSSYMLYRFFGPLIAAFMAIAFLAGVVVFPLGGFLFWWRFPAGIAEKVAFYYLRFGLIPYDDPVFQFGLGGFSVVEGKREVGGDARYRLATRWVGFDLDPKKLEELFAGLTETPEEIEARRPATVSDGGEPETPTGYVASPSLEVEGVQGYLPKRPREDTLYVRTDRAMSPFQRAQQGGRSYKAVEVAKEKFGAGWRALPEKWLYILTVIFGVLGLGFGFFSFHL